jgi:hypothetical protein
MSTAREEFARTGRIYCDLVHVIAAKSRLPKPLVWPPFVVMCLAVAPLVILARFLNRPRN